MPDNKINEQDQIKVIDDPVEAVRKLPDVYIGALGNAGFLNMYREIVQNSLDEIIKGNTLDKNIIISFDARNYTTIVEDNGQGIDLPMLGLVFSKLHSSSNYDKVAGSGRYSSGKNGMGATITNFLSKFFVAESYRMDGSAAKVCFEEGRISPEGVQPIKCPKGKHGLIVSFSPSMMMGEITVTEEEIERLTWILCNLCVIGTKITLNIITKLGRKRSVIIENKTGIYEILARDCEKPIIQPIYFEEDNGDMKVQVLMTYDSNMDDSASIIGTANMCPTDGGTHIDGFLDGIAKYFRDYMNKIYLANNKKLTVNAQDTRTGLKAVVSVYSLKPCYTGQSKNIYSETTMKGFVRDVTTKALANWAQSSPSDLQKVSKYLKGVCELRSKMDDNKVKISDSYNVSAVTDLPAKYKRPNHKGPFELWIVEGDSCASAMENNRDKSCQGVFPVRGKMLNAFVTPTKKYFDNEEVAGIFHICGYKNYAKKFNPDQFRPSKVVIATDADADGDHIKCLAFSLFLRYLPFVIEQGKLYVASPPLYGAKIGKDTKFFTGNKDYIEYVQSIFCKSYEVSDLKGKKYSKSDLTKILVRNIDYTKIMNHVSNTYAIDPYLLEFILMNRELPFAKFKTAVKKAYRFVDVEQQSNIIIIRGLVGSKYQTIFFDGRMLKDCMELISLINQSENYYKIDNQMVSLYGMMDKFSTFIPNGVSRYKGLTSSPHIAAM